MPKVCFGHLSIAYRTARVLRGGIAPEGIPRSSKLSEVAPQHGVKGRQIVLGELSADSRCYAFGSFADCRRNKAQSISIGVSLSVRG